MSEATNPHLRLLIRRLDEVRIPILGHQRVYRVVLVPDGVSVVEASMSASNNGYAAHPPPRSGHWWRWVVGGVVAVSRPDHRRRPTEGMAQCGVFFLQLPIRLVMSGQTRHRWELRS